MFRAEKLSVGQEEFYQDEGSVAVRTRLFCQVRRGGSELEEELGGKEKAKIGKIGGQEIG